MLITLLIINVLIILMNLIYVTPPVKTPDQPFPLGREDDIRQIKGMEETTARGWDNNNGTELSLAFTEQADYVTFNGEWYESREAIAKAHQDLFDGPLKGSSIDDRKIRAIRFVSDQTAIIHVKGAVKQKGRKKPAKSRLSIQTLVAIKENDRWKFTAFHNARIRRFSLWNVIMMSVK